MRYTLVYDSDCGPCTTFRNAVGLLGGGRRIGCIGLDEADRSGLLDQVPAARRHRSFHLVAPSGRISSGAAALPHLIGILPGGRPLSVAISKVPPLTSATGFVYGVFSRLHDSGTCSCNPDSLTSCSGSENLQKEAPDKSHVDAAYGQM